MSAQENHLLVKLREVPHHPGVYLMKDRLGSIIYVGKARDLRKRLSSYFSPSRSRLADHKTRALIRSIHDYEYHVVRNEPESLILESKLIKDYRPKYNVSFRDDKRFPLLKIHLGEPWPRFQVARVRREDGAHYFGPFPHAGALRKTLAWMTKEFGLRSCLPLQPTDRDYQHCSNDIIKNCTAPCIGRIHREAYLEQVAKACEFVRGQSRDILAHLEEEMAEAAKALDFERAAELRDLIESYRKTVNPARQFRRGRGVPGSVSGSTIDPAADVRELQEALGLEHPPAIMECFDISNISTSHCVASMVRFKNGLPDNQNYRRYRIKSVDGQNDFASMSEVVRRRYARILLEARDHLDPDDTEVSQENPLEVMRRLEEDLPEPKDSIKNTFVRLPDLVIVDGGKGQLSSALKELRRLGLQELPLIGLAKEREEIYRPGISEPLVLSHDTGALRLLQRIRDEAHRFANGYHQLLMKRRVAESLLDDCPGVSPARKQRLLTTFGSVARLRKATADEIASIPGIGKRLAEEVVSFLRSHQRPGT